MTIQPPQTRSLAAVLVLSVLILAASGVTSTGYFSIDELSYHAGIHAVATTGGYAIENGYETFASRDLLLLYLFPGPSGTVSSYPVGSAWAGALFYAPLGLRGVVILNALATCVTLLATRALALRLFGDDALALTAVLLLACCSFLTEYAFGIWPHALSTAAVTGALWLTARLLDKGAGGTVAGAIAAGAAVGAGMLMRLDVVLVLGPIGLAILLYARHPGRAILGGVIGLAPFLAAASIANAAKFGTYNPLSYGSSGGFTNIAAYLPLLGVMVVATFALLAIRAGWATPVTRRPGIATLALAVAASVVILLVPQAEAAARALLRGAHTLIVDARNSGADRIGIEWQDSGTLLFWGIAKKALGQSLPWIGLLLALFATRPTPRDRRALVILLAAVVVLMLPFVLLSWYGGLSRNMRYFLPVLPVLAVLGGYLWVRVLEGPQLYLARRILAFSAGLAAVAAWVAFHPSTLHGAQQILSLWVLAALAILALVLYLPGEMLRSISRIGFLFGAGVAMMMGLVIDVPFSQNRRVEVAAAGAEFVVINAPAVVYYPPEFAAPILFRDSVLLATPLNEGRAMDAGFVANAIAAGYRVYIDGKAAGNFVKMHPRFALGDTVIDRNLTQVIELLDTGG
ncbi:MAG: glycosyltransferase family 39 protein [Alphaproteobacteria bacterium]|nr:glycosyltransferase family 39 protein [Alphaproteobacteria bacterium]